MPSAGRRSAALAAAAAALALSLPIAAQVLYKWIDADGKVQYSDQPPKKHSGPVTRIEPDPAPAPGPVRKPIPVQPKPAVAPKVEAQPEDRATRRRATRDALASRWHEVRLARDPHCRVCGPARAAA